MAEPEGPKHAAGTAAARHAAWHAACTAQEASAQWHSAARAPRLARRRDGGGNRS